MKRKEGPARTVRLPRPREISRRAVLQAHGRGPDGLERWPDHLPVDHLGPGLKALVAGPHHWISQQARGKAAMSVGLAAPDASV